MSENEALQPFNIENNVMVDKLEIFLQNLVDLENELPEKTYVVIDEITSLPFMFRRQSQIRWFLFFNGIGFRRSKILAKKIIYTNKLFHSYSLDKSIEIHNEITKGIDNV